MVRNIPPKQDEDDDDANTHYRPMSGVYAKPLPTARNRRPKTEAVRQQHPSSNISSVPSTWKESIDVDRGFGSNYSQRLLMKSVPSNVKKDFLKVGFAYFGKEYLPLLQLSPFHVPPGRLRNLWIQMFRKSQDTNRPMARLVYWYGTSPNPNSYLDNRVTQQNGPAIYPQATTDTHVLIPATQIITYERALVQGYDKVPDRIKAKLDQGQRLKGTERQLVEGLRCIRKDARMAPEERVHHWFFDFNETNLVQVGDEIEKNQEKDDDARTQVSFQSAPVLLLNEGEMEPSMSIVRRPRHVKYSCQGALLNHNRFQSRPKSSPMAAKKEAFDGTEIIHKRGMHFDSIQTRQPTAQSRSSNQRDSSNHTKKKSEAPSIARFFCVEANPSDISSVNNGNVTDLLYKPTNNRAEQPPSLMDNANVLRQVIELPKEGTIIGLVILDDKEWHQPFLQSCVESSAAEKQIPPEYQSNMWILDIQAGIHNNNTKMGVDPPVSEMRTNIQVKSLLKTLQRKTCKAYVTLTLTPRIQQNNNDILRENFMVTSRQVDVGLKTTPTSRSALLESPPTKKTSVQQYASSDVPKTDIKSRSTLVKSEREGGSIQSSEKDMRSIEPSPKDIYAEEESRDMNVELNTEKVSLDFDESEKTDEAKSKREGNTINRNKEQRQGESGEPNKKHTNATLRRDDSDDFQKFKFDKYLPENIQEDESFMTITGNTVVSAVPPLRKVNLVGKENRATQKDEKEGYQTENKVERSTKIPPRQDMSQKELVRQLRVETRNTGEKVGHVEEARAKNILPGKIAVMSKGGFKSSRENMLRSDDSKSSSVHDTLDLKSNLSEMIDKQLSSFSDTMTSGAKKDLSHETSECKEKEDDRDLENGEERKARKVVESFMTSVTTEKQGHVTPSSHSSSHTLIAEVKMETELEASKDIKPSHDSIMKGDREQSSTSGKASSVAPTIVNTNTLDPKEGTGSSAKSFFKTEESPHGNGSQSSNPYTDDVASGFTSLAQKNRDRMKKLGGLPLPRKQNPPQDKIASNSLDSISNKISELSYPPTAAGVRQTLADRIKELAFQQQVDLDPKMPKCDQVARLECDLNGSRIYGKLIDRVSSLEDDVGLR